MNPRKLLLALGALLSLGLVVPTVAIAQTSGNGAESDCENVLVDGFDEEDEDDDEDGDDDGLLGDLLGDLLGGDDEEGDDEEGDDEEGDDEEGDDEEGDDEEGDDGRTNSEGTCLDDGFEGSSSGNRFGGDAGNRGRGENRGSDDFGDSDDDDGGLLGL